MPRDLESRFNLLHPPLGGGAFGLVYRAYDEELQVTVAIKVPHDKDKERALGREAQLMARMRTLHEPHVVTLHDLHVIKGRRTIVMEYVDGQSLRQRLGPIGEQKPLPLEEALAMACQACQGLHSLHRAFLNESGGLRGVFHRDIKPENILVRRRDGLVKIADFGIAVALEGSGQASTTAGTLPYMAPELLEGSGADYRADIYSLGVTLYEMLSGRLPYHPYHDDGRPKAPLVYGREICAGQAPHLCDIAPVDRELGDLVMRGMARRRRDRLQDVDQLRQALEAHGQRRGLAGALVQAWAQVGAPAQERALARLVEQYPDQPEPYRQLAKFHNRGLDHAQAAQVLEQGAGRCPSQADLLFDLALALHKTGRPQRAVGVLRQALDLGLAAEPAKRARRFLKIWGG